MTQIRDNFFKYNGNRYFRRNSLQIEVGSYGPKKTPLTQANYLAVEGRIYSPFLDGKLQKVSSGSIDWLSSNKTDIQGEVNSYFDINGATLNFTQKKAEEAQLKLIQIYIRENDLKTTLNNQANKARLEIKKEGKDARICSSVWVVMSGRLAKRFNSSLGLEASATTSKGLKITANGGTRWGGSETIELAPGTVFAYGLHKVKNWEGDKIDEMEDDWQSLN